MSPVEPSGVVVMIGGDLMARDRVATAAAGARLELRSARAGSVVDALRRERPAVVVVDLDSGGSAVLEELVDARSEGVAPERVLGFYSHVDEELGRAARAAGCEAVPRGRFWRALPELIGAPAGDR
jgi:hypothetical protein